MEVMPVSVDEIAVFKQAAAAYYKKAGVNPQIADKLFEAYLSKMAGEMGLVEQKPVSQKVNAVATKLATTLGRKRPMEKKSAPWTDPVTSKTPVGEALDKTVLPAAATSVGMVGGTLGGEHLTDLLRKKLDVMKTQLPTAGAKPVFPKAVQLAGKLSTGKGKMVLPILGGLLGGGALGGASLASIAKKYPSKQ